MAPLFAQLPQIGQSTELVLNLANLAATAYAGEAAAMTPTERAMIERGLNGWVQRMPLAVVDRVAGAADPLSAVAGGAMWGYRVMQLRAAGGTQAAQIAQLQEQTAAATQAAPRPAPPAAPAPPPPPPPPPAAPAGPVVRNPIDADTYDLFARHGDGL